MKVETIVLLVSTAVSFICSMLAFGGALALSGQGLDHDVHVHEATGLIMLFVSAVSAVAGCTFHWLYLPVNERKAGAASKEEQRDND